MNDDYDQSPYGYNQSNPNSQVFHEDPQGRKRGPELREAPEEEGGLRGKRRRI